MLDSTVPRRFATLLLVTIPLLSCRQDRKPATAPLRAVWRQVGSWSGKGNAQTESFDIGFSACRLRWEARRESGSGPGSLRIGVNSAVSGRSLAVPVDQQGPGSGVAYVSIDPHYSYLVIESSNVAWSVTVEELEAPSPP